MQRHTVTAHGRPDKRTRHWQSHWDLHCTKRQTHPPQRTCVWSRLGPVGFGRRLGGSSVQRCARCLFRPIEGHLTSRRAAQSSTDRWRGSQVHMSCAPCHGHMCASGELLGAAATRRLGRGVRALCVPPM